MKTEQQVLRVSLAVGIAVAALGIGFGLWAGSFSIIFDGMFGFVDAAMTILSLVVVGLINRSVQGGLSARLRERFTLGFWHFEPMVLALNGMILLAVTSYALVNAVQTILDGGREISFGPAIGYAAVVVLASALIAVAEHRANRRIGSEFVRMDVKGWIAAGGISLALLIAFGVGAVLASTPYDWLQPYVDPGVLILVCLAILPVPVGVLRRAMSQLALITPPELRDRVAAVARRVVADEGFDEYRAYTAEVGRSTQIELFFLVPTDQPARRLEDWDALRDRIRAELGADDQHGWITIAFTTDRRHAE